MKVITRCVLILALLGVTAFSCPASPKFTAPGPNVALGKSYTLDPDPNYRLCTDAGDLVQLTDGISAPTENAMWFFQECVGWHYPRPAVTITVDLGQDTPIAGASLSTQGGVAGVSWTPLVLVAVSQDGQQFQVVGELLHLSARHGVRPGSGRHVFATDDLSCHGRYARLIMAPGRYTFTDEVEIYRGPDELLEKPFAGQQLDDIAGYLSANQVSMAIRTWVAWDIFRAREELAASTAPRATLKRTAAALDRADAANARLVRPPGDDYRAIFPLTRHHRRVLSALGDLRRAEGRPRLELWKNNRWERLGLWTMPPEGPRPRAALQVRMIQGERRGDTVNIANNTRQPIPVRVWLEGLPGGTAPGYVSIREVAYVALASGTWDANALPEATREGGGWQITLPPGISRQLWFQFHPGAGVSPGNHRGTVVIEAQDGERLQLPVEFIVEPLQYPQEHSLAFGMWDYAVGAGSYGINPGNIPAAVAHMRSYGLNAPWARVFPWPQAEDFDADDRLVKQPDMSQFDAWVAMWPDARYYMVFPSVHAGYDEGMFGAAAGTTQFNRRVRALMLFWTQHAKQRGIDPSRIVILLVDEPTRPEHDELILPWARAIKAAAPEFKLFVDPAHEQPQKNALREMFEIHDIICPSLGIYEPGGQEVWDFYEELRAGGRELWLYTTVGGPASVDALAHYRAQEWKLWPMQGTGTHFWSYGDTGGAPTSWNTMAATGESYTPVYIDGESITDSKHWLALIEGIQDYEYLRMLQDRVGQLQATAQRAAAVARAEKLLNALPREVIAAVNEQDRNACDEGRLRVLDVLLELAD